MQIDLPEKAIELAESLATEDKDAAAVITEALGRMAWQRQEVAAIEEGVNAYNEGRHRPASEFFDDFMDELGLTPKA